MRSAIKDALPPRVRRSLQKLGRDLAIARKKRSLTVAMVTERAAIAKNTYLRVERGDPSVSVGIYAMVVFVLGLGERFAELADPGRDDQGLLLDEERLPQRVRTRKQQRAPG